MVVLANRRGFPLYVSTEEEAWPAYPLFSVVRTNLSISFFLLIYVHIRGGLSN
jgi:hypothetical protein